MLACVVLAARYALDARGSVAGRWIAVILNFVSLAVPDGLMWLVGSVVVQLGVSLFVLLRMRALAD